MDNISLPSGLGVGVVASGAGISVIIYSIESKFEKVVLHGAHEIISKYKGLPCVSSLFRSINWVSTNNTKNNETKGKISGDNSSIVLKNEQTQGCISVWWKKAVYKKSNKYWRGSWNLIWGLRDEDYGTIFTSTIIADHGRIQLDGIAHVLEKKGKKWITIGSWRLEKREIADKGGLSETVKPSDSLPESKDGWEFVKEVNFDKNSKKVCSKKNTCSDKYPSISYKKLNWIYMRGKKEGDQQDRKSQEWSSNIMNKWMSAGGFFQLDFAKAYANTIGYYRFI